MIWTVQPTGFHPSEELARVEAGTACPGFHFCGIRSERLIRDAPPPIPVATARAAANSAGYGYPTPATSEHRDGSGNLHVRCSRTHTRQSGPRLRPNPVRGLREQRAGFHLPGLHQFRLGLDIRAVPPPRDPPGLHIGLLKGLTVPVPCLKQSLSIHVHAQLPCPPGHQVHIEEHNSMKGLSARRARGSTPPPYPTDTRPQPSGRGLHEGGWCRSCSPALPEADRPRIGCRRLRPDVRPGRGLAGPAQVSGLGGTLYSLQTTACGVSRRQNAQSVRGGHGHRKDTGANFRTGQGNGPPELRNPTASGPVIG